MSRLDFLVLVLQSSNSFDLNAFFQVLFSLVLTSYKGHIRTVCKGNVNFCFQKLCVQLFFSAMSRVFFCYFFRSETSNGFPVKSMFLEGLSFLHFLCTVDTLNLCLRIRTPRLSLTMSLPAEAV